MTVKHLQILRQHNSSTNQTFEKDGEDVIQGLIKTSKSYRQNIFMMIAAQNYLNRFAIYLNIIQLAPRHGY